MVFRLLADAAMLVHFAFLVFVVMGGFLAWRWPWVIWPHLAAAGWGLLIVLFHFPCPLTGVEEWARERAGEGRLEGTGFIDHYLEDIVYPGEYTLALQVVAALVVVASWVGLWLRRSRGVRT